MSTKHPIYPSPKEKIKNIYIDMIYTIYNRKRDRKTKY